MEQLEREYIRTSVMLSAGEDWAHTYKQDPKSHVRLMRLCAKWQLDLNKMYKQMANNAASFINIGSYYSHITADYNVDIIINDQAFDDADNTFITVSLQTVTQMAATGALFGQRVYDIPLGLSPTSARIQHLSLQQVAGLVGKSVKPDGSIIDNPKAEYNVTDTLRKDIAQSVKTSLAMGENIQSAIERVQKTVADPRRAERIARTESVNAYQGGLREFALESNAVGKEWQDSGATDECADNTAAGPIAIDEDFPSGDSEPTAHPNCRCGMRYIYQQEWQGIEDGNPLEAESGITP